MKNIILILLLIVCMYAVSHAQGIIGKVTDEKQEPVAFANLFVPILQTGAATDINGAYQLNLPVGNYEIIISSVGYATKKIAIVVTATLSTYDFVLASQTAELEALTVRASRKDPAYEIIQLAIEHRDQFRVQSNSFRSQVYMKAIEEIEQQPQVKATDEAVSIDETPEDPFEMEKKTQQGLLASLNMAEMELTLNFLAPNHYKEERTAYKRYGNPDGLFLPNLGETTFNFYDNLVYFNDIADAPIISPISRTAILSYKYKLEESIQEGAYVVHKIKVSPRNHSGNSSISGYIYINEGLWNINRIDVVFSKGAPRIYDQFQFKQDYQLMNDSLWMPTRQEFIYETAQGKKKVFKGSTLIIWKTFEANYAFPPNFFGAEVAVTTKEAYSRDSSYWQQARVEPLKIKEQQVVHLRDSIELAHKSPAYRDSIEAAYNRITVGEVLYSGMGFRKDSTKRHIYLGPIAELIGFQVAGGFRLGTPYVSYFRRLENGKMVSLDGNASIGLKNSDLQGRANAFFRYQPFRMGDVRMAIGRSFQSINPYDAYLNQLKVSNYILNDFASVWHRIELLNGLYLSAGLSFRNRYSLEGFDTDSFLGDIVGPSEALPFENYQALIAEWKIAYTPKQRYMTEPNRKIILGSQLPTFSLLYRKGLNGPLGSDIHFDYWEGSIEQNIILGMLGNSKYTVTLGKFTNTKNLRFVDAKRFRQSDPYLYSDPLHTFQLLDTALTTSSYFVEAHHIHHFNGAFLNSLPLIKKMRVGLVAGAGMMWSAGNSYRHEELFVGLERSFKLSARRRLRLGVYGVAANSNQRGLQQGFKISFDIIDAWKKDWSF